MAWFYNSHFGHFPKIGLVAHPKTALNQRDTCTKHRTFASNFAQWTAHRLTRASQSERYLCAEFARFHGLF
jgi:hypothetical protein